MDPASVIWLVLLVVFLIVEGACPVHLVSIWFAAGALAAGLAALCGGAVWLQITLFLVVSCGLLIATLPLIKKFMTPKIIKTNVDSIIGSQGYVTASVDNLSAVGQVKLGGMEWTARSHNGNPIPAGTLVRVEGIEGVKAIVSPVNAEALEEAHP